MIAKSQDVVVALRLLLRGAGATYAELGQSLNMSASEAHAAVRRLTEARLLDPETREVRREPLRNYLLHGVPYAFPAAPKEITRGMPTAWAAPVMADKVTSADQVPPVWRDPDGKMQGSSVEPLYPSVPATARRDPELYALLALVDAVRIGRARERAFAEKEITKRLSSDAHA